MTISLNENLSEIKSARLIKATVTEFRADLAEFRAEDVNNLTQSSELKRLGCNSQNSIVHIEKLWLPQISSGQEITL